MCEVFRYRNLASLESVISRFYPIRQAMRRKKGDRDRLEVGCKPTSSRAAQRGCVRRYGARTNPPMGLKDQSHYGQSGAKLVRSVEHSPASGASGWRHLESGGQTPPGVPRKSRPVKSSTMKGAQALAGQLGQRRSRMGTSRRRTWVRGSFCVLPPEIKAQLWKLWESGSFPHTGVRPGIHGCPDRRD